VGRRASGCEGATRGREGGEKEEEEEEEEEKEEEKKKQSEMQKGMSFCEIGKRGRGCGSGKIHGK
jgi:CO dehydrogenase/acetyl-CoA synthase beta subunit